MENNPVLNQPSSQPESPSVPQDLSTKDTSTNNIKKLMIISGVVLLLFLIGGSTYLLGLNTNKQETVQEPSQNEVTTVSLSPTISVYPTTNATTPDIIPQENTLYLGMYEGKYAIFFTNLEKQKYYEDGNQKTSPYIGELKTIDGLGISSFNYKNEKLINPQRIMNISTYPLFSTESIKFNNENTILYLSINLEEQTSEPYPGNLVNRIYQIRINQSSNKEIWSNEIGSSKYKGKGTTYISQISKDRYIVMSLGGCYACEGGTPKETIIVNIDTKNEKYLADAGDIQINNNNKTFTYKKYASFQEPCDEPGMGCDNGQRTVLKPSGQVYTDNLP